MATGQPDMHVGFLHWMHRSASVKRHHLAGHDDVDFLGFVLADRHGETAADDVAQHVVGDIVEICVGAVLLQEVDGGDDAAPGTADARLRSTGFDTANILEADPDNVFQLEILYGAPLGRQVQHRLLLLGVQD